ncbi:MAG: hypothetical protein Q9M40_07045 [Sulfurimonas sp.]|nr:hypothetical protein [Sulfurimonas sp.]MDQ7067730.1 hypothetical protein [Sulfurimonas sp.]
MGWYDAFRKTDVTKVDTSPITTSAAAGATAFGDAFTSFGKALTADEKFQAEQVVRDAEQVTRDKKNALLTSQAAQIAQNTLDKKNLATEKTRAKTQQKFDDAFVGYAQQLDSTENLKLLRDNYIAPEGEVSTDGYTAINSRINTITTQENDKSNEISKLKIQQGNTKHANQILKLQEKITNSKSPEDKKVKQVRDTQNFSNKVAKGMVDKIINKDGVTTQDQDQVNFYTDYIDTNYDPVKYPNMEAVKVEAKQAYEIVMDQKNKLEAMDIELEAMENYKELTPEEQVQAKEFYVATGTLPEIQEIHNGLFTANTFKLKQGEEVTKSTTRAKKSKWSDYR